MNVTDIDTKTVAQQLLDKGWNPLPLPARAKYSPPEGYTGYRGVQVTQADVDRFDWSGNICIRMPDDVIGIDVDSYKGGDLGSLTDAIGVPLPPTVWSTSKLDGSGIAFFRVPVGTTLKANPSDAIEIIQASHRYAVTWPSIHPSGDQYKWVDEQSLEELDAPPDIDDLAELPHQWLTALYAVKTATAPSASTQDVVAFVRSHQAAQASGRLKGVRTRLNGYNGSRHDTLVEVSCWAMREAAAGCYTASEAIDVLEEWWHKVIDDPKRLDGNEFGAAISWAVSQASLDPARIAQIRADMAAAKGTEQLPDAALPSAVDADTGETVNAELSGGFNLPDEFWQARPALAHIRAAAHCRNRGAEAVLVATLGRVATLVPPNVVLPAIVGSQASLNFFCAIVARSGGGKTTSATVARQLVPIDRKDIIDPLTPGSGEGLVDAYFDMVDDVNPDTGKKEKRKLKTKTAVYVVVDEGQSLLQQKDRSGATIMPTIRSAWSGTALGQANAGIESRRFLADSSYRMAMLLGFQLAYAADLIADGEGGTPQRFVFAPAIDPSIPEERTKFPGALPWAPPATIAGDVIEILVDDDIADGIYMRDLQKARGEYTPHELNSHADLVRLKVAALLGILDERLEVNKTDWQLAGMIMERSNAVRAWAIDFAKQQAAAEAEGRTLTSIEREFRATDIAEAKALKAGAKNAARACHKAGRVCTVTELSRAVAGRYKRLVDVEQMLDSAVSHGWLAVDGDGWKPGPQVPA